MPPLDMLTWEPVFCSLVGGKIRIEKSCSPNCLLIWAISDFVAPES